MHHQSACNCTAFHAACICKPGRIYVWKSEIPRECNRISPSAQWQRMRCCRFWNGITCRCRQNRGYSVWKRWAYRKCRYCYTWYEYVFSGCRSKTWFLWYAAYLWNIWRMYRNESRRKKSVQWCTCICRIFRLSSGCNCQGYALERWQGSGSLECSVSSNRSDRCGKKLWRRCYPHQQPVR